MQIIFLHSLYSHYFTTGITRYIDNLAKGLEKRGHQVFLLSGEEKIPSIFRHLRIGRVLQFFYSGKRDIEMILEKRQEALSIVHTQGLSYFSTFGALRAKKPHAVVITQHSLPDKKLFRKLFLFFIRVFAAKPCKRPTVRIITVSPYVKERLAPIFPQPKKIHFIPNGVDTDLFRPLPSETLILLKQKWGVSDKKNVFLFVGRLARQKNPALVIRLLRQVSGDLLVVGDGIQREYLKILARFLGVEKRVRFLGLISTSEIIECYNIADVMILPSFFEGLPFVLLEALACGTPVVASDISGVRKVLKEIGGTLVPLDENCEKNFAAGITKIINNPNFKRTLSVSGRELIEKKYSIESMVNAIESLYQETISYVHQNNS